MKNRGLCLGPALFPIIPAGIAEDPLNGVKETVVSLPHIAQLSARARSGVPLYRMDSKMPLDSRIRVKPQGKLD